MQTYKPIEVAGFLRCCRETIMRRIREGKIKTVCVSKVRRIPESEVRRLTTLPQVSDEARRIFKS